MEGAIFKLLIVEPREMQTGSTIETLRLESNEALTHMIEKPRREQAVSDCARIGIGNRPQIRTRPEEFVGLTQDNP